MGNMSQRFYSLDVFRGATVALMILVNNPGSWGHIYPPLEHAAWHGVTPTDLVFPFFLFAVGNAFAFVMPRLQAAGPSTFWKKVIKRTLLIFGIGLFLNWYPFIRYNAEGSFEFKQFANIRIFGVLQRIAVCYFFASIIVYYFKPKAAAIVSALILLFYWALCYFSNPADPYSLSGWFGTARDIKIIGLKHMYKGEGVPFDPEGIYSSFAGIVQVVIGYFVGRHIVTKGKTAEMLNGLFVAGCLFVFVGFCWDMTFPLNKKIWTSSYTIYTSGLAMLILSLCIYLLDFKNKKGIVSRFFDVFGKNPLFIFAMSAILPRTLSLIRIPGKTESGEDTFYAPFAWFYNHVCKPLFDDPRNSSLLYALLFITMMWFLAWILDKKKIYIKV